MAQLVRLGDSSSHGGKMIQATGSFLVNGIAVCVTGDIHQCPIDGHGNTAVTGTSGIDNNGKAVVKTGDQAGCGAAITQGSPDTFTD